MAAKKKAKPKQADLPGMEDRSIDELETLASEYAEHRDNRIEELKEEVRIGQDLIAAMKKHKKTSYHRKTAFGDVRITLVTEKEKIKVKIKKEDDGEAVDMT